MAEQAATGTYNSDQRLMIDSEFQAMAEEINRIANATTFNGVHLLNGNLAGAHDGSGLVSAGAAKIHFGAGNDAAEDYYYLTMGDATVAGIGLAVQGTGGAGGTGGTGGSNVPVLGGILANGGPLVQFTSGVVSFAVIPTGAKNISIHIDCIGENDSIEVFTRDGKHLAGTTLWSVSNTSPSPAPNSDWDWKAAGINSVADINSQVLTQANGFLPGATYDQSPLNGMGTDIPVAGVTPGVAGNFFSYNGMNFGYSGDVHPLSSIYFADEYLTIDEVKEDLVLLIVGGGVFWIQASWTYMPTSWGTGSGGGGAGGLLGTLSLSTQALAQEALVTINDAIVAKDKIRAHLGAMQNRLENTVANIQIQAENLQAAESRISDVDVSREMTEFVRKSILTQAAVSMLAQANALPSIVMQLLKNG